MQTKYQLLILNVEMILTVDPSKFVPQPLPYATMTLRPWTLLVHVITSQKISKIPKIINFEKFKISPKHFSNELRSIN
jgi:hypothetical protein